VAVRHSEARTFAALAAIYEQITRARAAPR
jgi:hypothetical protein